MSPWARDIFRLFCVGWLVFWKFGGLTCDFWAEFEEKKQRQRQRQLNQSLRPSGFAPAFGRAVGRCAVGLDAGLKPSSISEATARANGSVVGGRFTSPPSQTRDGCGTPCCGCLKETTATADRHSTSLRAGSTG